MGRFLAVFCFIAIMGVAMRFGPHWAWWLDLSWIVLTSLMVAALCKEDDQ